jgi:hypothetical protein
MTVSDEAFVLLSVENCWDAIQEVIKDSDDEEDGKRVSMPGASTQIKE